MLFSNGQQLPAPQVHSVLLSKDVSPEKHPPGFLILKALSHLACQTVCQGDPQICEGNGDCISSLGH